ncbi:MAG TPA: hypothetical protein VH518_11450 [Tepidisphaeraceae bacterium]|jgi:hypothetical protein
MRGLTFAVVVAAVMSSPALGQIPPPFFGGGATAFDPQPGIVESGALLDAQATVSADRKYVTLNMRATDSRLRALINFPVVNTQALGFVGGAALGGEAFPPGTPISTGPRGTTAVPTAGAPGQAAAVNAIPSPPSPDQISRNAKSWILTRQGMYLIQPLD